MKKVAFFVDWDNLRYSIRQIKHKNRPDFDDFDYNNAEHIAKLFKLFLEPDNEEYYRIFFYTARPLRDEEIMSKLGNKSAQKGYKSYLEDRIKDNIYNIASAFLDSIVEQDYIALRTGKMQVRGFKDGRLDIVQKQVDMLIGLDISEVSYNKHADKIIVFSKDTDMIPALKTARINGLEVCLANFEENNFIAQDLIIHSDKIVTKNFKELITEIKR